MEGKFVDDKLTGYGKLTINKYKGFYKKMDNTITMESEFSNSKLNGEGEIKVSKYVWSPFYLFGFPMTIYKYKGECSNDYPYGKGELIDYNKKLLLPITKKGYFFMVD